jgi:hypothetical protein
MLEHRASAPSLSAENSEPVPITAKVLNNILLVNMTFPPAIALNDL